MALSAVVLLFLIPLLIPASVRAIDFTSFFCAGQAVAAHADPYRAVPLGECERRVFTGWFFHRGVVMPAPLPPYALAVTSVVARLSFAQAAFVLDALSIASLVASVAILTQLTGAGKWLVLFALAPLSWIVLFLGQTVLLVLCAVATAAYLLRCGRDRWAAVAAALTMMNPHIGIAVCLSLFLWRRQTRTVFLGVAVAAALASVAIVSWPTSLEYFTTVLPLHARSEALSVGQFSATVLLARLGVPVSVALAIGSVQYAVTVGIGVVLAHRIAVQRDDLSVLASVPALFAVVGGTYIHNTDFLLAVPAGLMLLQGTVHRGTLGVAIIALAPHVMVIGGWPGAVLGAVAAGGILLSLEWRLLGAVVAAILFALAFFSPLQPIDPRATINPVPASAYADQSWSQYVAAVRPSWADLVIRIPEWAALVALCLFATTAARKNAGTTLLGAAADPQRRRRVSAF